MNTQTSPFANINWQDIKNAGVHLLLGALVSFVLYLIDTQVPQLNFGANTALIAPVVAFLASTLKSYLTNYQAKVQ